MHTKDNKDNLNTFFKDSENECDIYFKIWNLFAEKNGLTKIIKLTDKRKNNIACRLKEKEFDFENILNKISQSDFLLGKRTDWRIDFDFIVGSKNNYIKILEGNYNGNGKSGATADGLNSIAQKYWGQNNRN